MFFVIQNQPESAGAEAAADFFACYGK